MENIPYIPELPCSTWATKDQVVAECDRLRSEIADLRSANAELKLPLEDAKEQADIHRQWNLGYMKSNDDHRTALLASLAREARLREALENYKILCQDENHYSHYVDALKALELPHDDTALREYLDTVIEECLGVCQALANDEEFGHLYATGASECEAVISKLLQK